MHHVNPGAGGWIMHSLSESRLLIGKKRRRPQWACVCECAGAGGSGGGAGHRRAEERHRSQKAWAWVLVPAFCFIPVGMRSILSDLRGSV